MDIALLHSPRNKINCNMKLNTCYIFMGALSYFSELETGEKQAFDTHIYTNSYTNMFFWMSCLSA